MKTYNVKATVVGLVDADNEEQARAKFQTMLDTIGFDIYNDIVYGIDIFESEPL